MIMELDAQDTPGASGRAPEALVAPAIAKAKAMRDGIQLSEAITGDGVAIFSMRAGWP
jgi:hypothetical protein